MNCFLEFWCSLRWSTWHNFYNQVTCKLVFCLSYSQSYNCLSRSMCWTNTCFWHQSPWSTWLICQRRITSEKRTNGRFDFPLSFYIFYGFLPLICYFILFYFISFHFIFLRLAKIKEWVDAHDPGAMVIPLSGCVEAKLQEMEDDERNKYCEEQKTQRSDK